MLMCTAIDVCLFYTQWKKVRAPAAGKGQRKSGRGGGHLVGNHCYNIIHIKNRVHKIIDLLDVKLNYKKLLLYITFL